MNLCFRTNAWAELGMLPEIAMMGIAMNKTANKKHRLSFGRIE